MYVESPEVAPSNPFCVRIEHVQSLPNRVVRSGALRAARLLQSNGLNSLNSKCRTSAFLTEPRVCEGVLAAYCL